MEGLSCESCRNITNEFTILACDHIICAECLWGEVRTSLQGINSIRCSCGTLTTFSKAQPLASKIASTTSPRCPSARKLRTDTATLSVRTPSSPQRMGESRIIGQNSSPELHSELQFLSVQFRKTMEEVERNFKRVIESITTKYSNLMRNIRLFWLQEVVESQPITLLQLPKLLMKKYQKSVGFSLQRINQALLDHLTEAKFETQPAPRVTHPCKHHSQQKENRPYNIDERHHLMQLIQELKESRGGGIRKMGRKGRPLFQRV